jgi:hypothetical protein
MSKPRKTAVITIRQPLNATFEAAENLLHLIPATRLKEFMREHGIPIPKNKSEMIERILDRLDFKASEVSIALHPVIEQ